MRVLLTNHHLTSFGGTEMFTLEAAKLLSSKGHEVCVYTKFLGAVEDLFNAHTIPVTTNLADYADLSFDVAHIHHSVTALEVRHLFPHLPLFFLSHGTLPFLEQPPEIDLNISLFGGVSEHVVAHLVKRGVSAPKTVIIPNIIDASQFFSHHPINTVPRRALCISSKLSRKYELLLKRACARLDILLTFVGGRFGNTEYTALPTLINDADIVFSLGRGAMEALLCGRAAVVFDEPGFDGMVTPDNFDRLASHNFTGKKLRIKSTLASVLHELKKYNAADAGTLALQALDRFAPESVYPKLIDAYNRAITLHKENRLNTELIEFVVKSIHANNFFGYDLVMPLHNQILQSKFYTVWRILNRLKPGS